jgi:DNA-binding NtrC family response regulator
MKTEKILVVDDEQVICDSVKKILTRKGYSVDTALSANEALEKIQMRNFDLVITDIMMPELDGIDFLKFLKENYGEIDVIMITGYPSIESTVKAIKLGAFDYLQKPFTPDELSGRVLKLKEFRESLDAKPETLDADMPFDRQAVENATSKEYMKGMNRSDFQKVARKTLFCDMGGRECRMYYNTGIMCEGECPIVRKEKENALKNVN